MVPILTYHSQNIEGNSTADNDHAALAADLRALHNAGRQIISLDRLMDWLDGETGDGTVHNAAVLTFDDGCDFDVRDIDYPGHGLQRSFLGIMQDFLAELPPGVKPFLHATSFVIASREARQQIDAGSLFGKGWISDDWWQQADSSRMYSVENHGWDHNHPDLEGDARGNFHTVDTPQQCEEQVIRASAFIGQITGRQPEYFAYPFGESSEYIRETWFPGQAAHHGCRAALGTAPGHVRRDTNRWNLPRYVCGRDWKSPEALLALLG